MTAAVEYEKLGVRKQLHERAAVLDRNDDVPGSAQDQSRGVMRRGSTSGAHPLVAPHLDYPRGLLGLGAQRDVSGPTPQVIDVGLGEKVSFAAAIGSCSSRTTRCDIDNGRLKSVVAVAPFKPVEFAVFRIQQWIPDKSNCPKAAE